MNTLWDFRLKSRRFDSSGIDHIWDSIFSGALLASHETVAIALSFVLYYLADHPDVYAKVLKGDTGFPAALSSSVQHPIKKITKEDLSESTGSYMEQNRND
ncbi:hypothetical protein RJ639_023293 [Escallonia herrerae]|uniref:Cytochrome P450 n=1 Tax=Escallonia herrerae TaxID=1293975 RepID=A0AA88UYJ3_9ASTE|nr:hypothetical protein RJ639_023293 [Escallonia herrerae]